MKLLAVFVLILPAFVARAQSDAEKFAEGRIALDKHKDCPAARDALESVSDKGKSEPLWVFYAAKTYECLKQADKALQLYQKYNELMPGQAAIVDKIGELRYEVGQQQREKEGREAARRMLPELLEGLQNEPLLHTSWDSPFNGQILKEHVEPIGKSACQFGVTHITLGKSLFLPEKEDAILDFTSERISVEIIRGNGIAELAFHCDGCVSGLRIRGPEQFKDAPFPNNYSLEVPPSTFEPTLTALKERFERVIKACQGAGVESPTSNRTGDRN